MSTIIGLFKLWIRQSFFKNYSSCAMFGKCLADVLFEETKFDHDEGRRHKNGFTRQDEETTFNLIANFVVIALSLRTI